MKTEPNTYSWDDLVKDKSTYWDGVRNYAARNNMRAMSKGDHVFIYHSVKQREIIGIAEVTSKKAYQDPSTDDDRWSVVDIKAVRALKRPVSLDEIKERKSLSNMVLVNNSRLSVQPVRKSEFDTIVKMSEK